MDWHTPLNAENPIKESSEGRNANDLSYDDRSFTTPISSPFKYFTSIPVNHFKQNQALFQNDISSSFNNLGITDVFNFDLDGSVIYYNSTDTVASTVQKLELANFSISNTKKASVVSNSLIDFSGLTDETNAVAVHLKLYGDLAEEKILNKIYNSLINDTIRAAYFLKDY